MFSFIHVDEFRLVTGYNAWLGLGNWEGEKKSQTTADGLW